MVDFFNLVYIHLHLGSFDKALRVCSFGAWIE